MATSIWPWRRTMLVKERSTALTAFPRSAKRAIMYRKCRTLTSVPIRAVFLMLGFALTRFAAKSTRMDEPSSTTIETIFTRPASSRFRPANSITKMPSTTPSTAASYLLRMFARVSPFFVLLSFFAVLASARAASPAAPTATVKRQAQAQFERSEQQRAALSVKSHSKRTLADYRQVVASYRRVYLITPRAAEVPDALLAISQLYTEMGERF